MDSTSEAFPKSTSTLRVATGGAFAWLLFACGATLEGQVLPLGGEFQVNVGPPGYNYGAHVASQAGGGFVVVWQRSHLTGGAHAGRRFDAAGDPISGELEVAPASSRRVTDLGADSAGNFVAVWGESYSGPGGGSPDDVHARLLLADGTPVGAPFQVNSGGPAPEYSGPESRVAVHADGHFVVVWNSDAAWGRRFLAGGAPVGADFLLAPSDPGAMLPNVASRPSGGFVVCWTTPSATLEGFSWLLRAQRFSAAGDPVGDIIEVAELGSESYDLRTDIAVSAAGQFAIVWQQTTIGFEANVHARLFALSGAPLGPAFRVHEAQSGFHLRPAVTYEPGGNLTVVWNGAASEDAAGVYGRRFAPDGTPLGPQFRVDEPGDGSQVAPDITAGADQTLIVTWSEFVEVPVRGFVHSVRGRRLRVPFFTDGFESGTTSRWSAAQSLRRFHPDEPGAE